MRWQTHLRASADNERQPDTLHLPAMEPGHSNQLQLAPLVMGLSSVAMQKALRGRATSRKNSIRVAYALLACAG